MSPLGRFLRWVLQSIPTLLVLGVLAGLIYLGQQVGWTMPKFSTLLNKAEDEKDDWCEAHAVPQSICVECKKDLFPRGPEYGWCAQHGIPDCPLCHPDVAELSSPPSI